jgi:hypothetical protein
VAKIRCLLACRDGDAVDDEPDVLAYAQAEAGAADVACRSTTANFRVAPPLRVHQRLSLHADTSVDAADWPALERLVRYLLRPLISADRLTTRPDGRVEYHFRRPDPSGRTSWVTDGTTWCRRLATLIPPRRSHTTRFHGVLSSAHVWRSRVVPSLPTAEREHDHAAAHADEDRAQAPGPRCCAGSSATRSPSAASEVAARLIDQHVGELRVEMLARR